MMRYQRVSPDCLHLGNGGKSNLRTCKDDEGGDNGRIPNYSTFKGKPLKFRSPSNCLEHNFSHSVTPNSPQHDNHVTPKNQNHESIAKSSPNRGSDVLLQWGQNKRSRGPRTENHRVSSDDSSGQARQVIKIHRRVVEKQPSVNQTATMPPPPPPCSSSSYSRGGNPRSSTPSRETSGAFLKRSLDERSSTGHGSPSRSNGGSSSIRVGCRSTEKVSPSSPEKTDQKIGGSVTVMAEKSNGCLVVQAGKMNLGESNTEQETGGHAYTEKVNLDQFEWPRIYISLSRKEKEDDFLAMKGTKLPQRPKKRAKNIDKTLQYCFPGMWLSDLTRGRYEVREKKCVKKQKRKGLKGMESMDSDSEE